MSNPTTGWDPATGSPTVKSFVFDFANQVVDSDNSAFKIPGFDAPASALVFVLGGRVLTAFDDSQAGSLSLANAAVASPFSIFAGNDTGVHGYAAKSAFFATKTRLDLQGFYGDGTQGKMTVYYEILPA